MSVTLRPAQPRDLAFLLSLAPRLAEFGLPDWRTGVQVVEAERRALARAVETASPDAPIFIAEEGGSPAGFVYVEMQTDFFTGRPTAHVSILAVTDAAQGHGIGAALLDAAEAWARARECSFISLNVFPQNTRARNVYERLGYGLETLRYVKPLGGETS